MHGNYPLKMDELASQLVVYAPGSTLSEASGV